MAPVLRAVSPPRQIVTHSGPCFSGTVSALVDPISAASELLVDGQNAIVQWVKEEVQTPSLLEGTFNLDPGPHRIAVRDGADVSNEMEIVVYESDGRGLVGGHRY